MLKRTIKYEDFDDVEREDIFYFNISKSELIELEVEYDAGFGEYLKRIIESKDNKELIKQFKAIVLMAYGQRSEDGKRFIKSDTLREEFQQTAAYNALFMELAMDDNAAVVFIEGVLPKDMVGEVTKALAPTPPAPPTPPSS